MCVFWLICKKKCNLNLLEGKKDDYLSTYENNKGIKELYQRTS